MSPEELLAAAGRAMGSMGAQASNLFAMAQLCATHIQGNAFLMWQMSMCIRELSRQLQAAQDQLYHRPVLPPYPKSVTRALQEYEICEPCRTFSNVIFDVDDNYTQFFCASCCARMAADSKCRRCDGKVFVDGLGHAAPFCKECAQGECSVVGCHEVAGGKSGLCDTCFRKRTH